MDATIEDSNMIERAHDAVDNKNAIDYNYLRAGFRIRFWAYLVDLIVIGRVGIRIVIYPLFGLMGLNNSDSFMFSPVSIATTIIFFAYFVLTTKYLKQTLGKMIFGIKVVSLKGDQLIGVRFYLRELIGRYISKTIWIAYIVVAFTPKKQGLP